MKLMKALRSDALGIHLELPETIKVVSEADDAAQLIDEEHGVQWWLFWFAGMDMAIGSAAEASLAVAMRHHAVAMFEAMFQKKATAKADEGEAADAAAAANQSRTADPTWSPMIDLEHVKIGEDTPSAAAALRTVHRMTYQPGNEIVMGHLLVPLAGGLFEARLIARDELTGVRESVMLASKRGGGDGDGEPQLLTQAEYDDPARDADFPMHALTRVRAALRWMKDEVGLRVLAPAAQYRGGEVQLKQLQQALVPPARFVRFPALDDHDVAGFQRVSFCGTDGLERLLVQRVGELGKVAPAELRARAEAFTRQLHQGKGAPTDLTLTTTEEELGGRPRVEILVEGRSEGGDLRNLLCWFLDGRGRPCFLGTMGSQAVPVDERRAELRAAVASWRSTEKPWWKLW